MDIFLIIFIFLLLKIFQYFNAFVLDSFLGSEDGIAMATFVFIFISVLFVFIILLKKFFPKAINFAGLFIVLLLIIFSQINVLWMMFSFIGIFLCVLIGIEAQTMKLMSSCKNVPRILMLFFGLLPVIFYPAFSQVKIIVPNLYYIVSSFFSFAMSYFVHKYEIEPVSYKNAPPVWLGFIFIIGSVMLYFLEVYGETEVSPVTLSFILFFYLCGAFLVYTSINGKLRAKPIKN
jgi:hypothetical protein